MRDLEGARAFLREGHWLRQPRVGLGQLLVTLREMGEAVGVCGLFLRPYLETVDVGFAILERYQRRGFALEAARAVVGYAREELGIERFAGIVKPGNEGAIRVLERLGLRFEGRVASPAVGGECLLYVGAAGGEGSSRP